MSYDQFIPLTLEQAKEMEKYLNAASKIYDENHDAYFDEKAPNHKTLRKQIHDLHQDMVRVVLPGFNLPDDYHGFPSFLYSRPCNWAQYEEAQDVFYGYSRWSRKITEKITEDNVDELAKLAEEYSVENLREKRIRDEQKKGKHGHCCYHPFDDSFCMKFQQTFPEFESGFGFVMTVHTSPEPLKGELKFDYPSHDIDIAKKLAEDWKSVSHVVKHLNERERKRKN